VIETVPKVEGVYRYRCCNKCNKIIKTKEVIFDGKIPQKTKNRKPAEERTEVPAFTSKDLLSAWR
jgi:hypothetical protein